MNLLLLLALTLNNVAFSSKDFWAQRKEIIAKEDEQAVGAQLELTEQEQCVSDILNEIKLKEWHIGYNNPKQFHPSRHFFETNSFIEQSSVFYFLKNLPKGALLHTHFYGMVSSEFIYNLTYSEDLFACYHEDRMLLHFFYDHVDNRCDWLPVRYLRKADKMFDKRFKSNAFMPNIAESKPFDDNTDAEYAFTQAKDVLFGLISYKPIFYKYFYRGLEELYEDRVMYVELRSTVLPVYDLEGNVYESYEVVQMMKEIVEEFKCSHPSFIGAKLIYSGRMIVTDEKEDIVESVQRVLAVAKYFPDFIVGYDVMRREEMKDVLAKILDIVQSQPDLKFFFHAGATNWFGGQTDSNVLDAILMNTFRIGHGLSLVKHPELLRIIKERNIPIEICPISNQVFGLVTDVRNHPASHFLSHGYPVVIGNDDPGLWNAKGVTYDWYMVFMGMAKVDRDLRMLKQLAINSIIYSGMDDREKGLVEFAKMWSSFINSIPRCNRNAGSGDDPDVSGGIFVKPDGSGSASVDYEEFTPPPSDEDSGGLKTDYFSDSIDSAKEDTTEEDSEGSGILAAQRPSHSDESLDDSRDIGSTLDEREALPEIEVESSAQAATIGPVEEVTEYGKDLTLKPGDREIGSGATDRGIEDGGTTVAGGPAALVTGVDRADGEGTVAPPADGVTPPAAPPAEGVTPPADGAAPPTAGAAQAEGATDPPAGGAPPADPPVEAPAGAAPPAEPAGDAPPA